MISQCDTERKISGVIALGNQVAVANFHCFVRSDGGEDIALGGQSHGLGGYGIHIGQCRLVLGSSERNIFSKGKLIWHT